MDKLILIAGTCLILFSVYQYTAMQNFLANSEKAIGIVVDVVKRTSDSDDVQGSESYHYWLEFKTPSGETVKFESEAGSSEKLHKVGEQLPVRFSKRNPADAKVDLFWTTKGMPLIFFMAGFALLIVGWLRNS